MKNKILCFGLVLIFLTSMCGCNAEKADILESSDIADCSSSVSNTETSDETDTTVKSEPEKLTETAITTSEPISKATKLLRQRARNQLKPTKRIFQPHQRQKQKNQSPKRPNRP